MLKAARGYGLDAKAYRKEPDQLKDVNLPAILFWNFNHFVVLEGFGSGGFYLNDPARGRVLASEKEFFVALPIGLATPASSAMASR